MRFLALSGVFGAAVCLLTSPVAAQTGPTPAGPQPKDVEIPGTLDPATGRFTPDRQSPPPTTASANGNYTINFNITPAARKINSILCYVEIQYYETVNGEQGQGSIEQNGVSNFSLKYDSTSNSFKGSTKPLSFNFSDFGDTDSFSSAVDIYCYYYDEPNASALHFHTSDDNLHSGSHPVNVTGTLRD